MGADPDEYSNGNLKDSVHSGKPVRNREEKNLILTQPDESVIMRILMLNYEFPPLGGGAANATFSLLKEMTKLDVAIDLVVSSTGHYKQEQVCERVIIHYLEIGKRGGLHHQTNRDLLSYSWKAYYYCKQLMKQKRFDLTHAFFGIPCGYLAMRLKLPYIISLRGSDVPGHNQSFDKIHKLLYFVNKKTWENARMILANSQDLKDTALKTGFSVDITVIPNGVDCKFYSPIDSKVAAIPLKLLFVGRMNKVKNIEYILRALNGLPGIEFTVVGDGPERKKLQNLTAELKLTDHVHFLGRVEKEELANVYRTSDLFILPSKSEGGSNTVLEALASGLPIIVTNTGGAETLVHGNGFILNEATEESIREKLNYFIVHQENIPEMGQKSRAIAESLSWESAARKYREIYRELAKTPH